jgi:preprotein translocase SecE subunit
MYARASAALVLGFTVLYGCWELYQSLDSLPPMDSVNRLLGRVGVNLELKWGMLVAGIVFVALLGLVLALTFGFATQMRLLKGLEAKSQAFVEFLIDVEGELRKVAWPSRKQLMNLTSVVLLASLLVAIFVLGVDQVLQQVMRLAGIL